MITTVKEAKTAVRVMRKFMKEHAPEMAFTHNAGLQLLAEMLGCKTWNELNAKLAETPSTIAVSEKPNIFANDTVPPGEFGKLETLSGEPIAGTYEVLYGTADVLTGARLPDGSFDLDYGGYTDIDWDAQKTVKDPLTKEWLFVTEDGDIVPASQVRIVSESESEDSDS